MLSIMESIFNQECFEINVDMHGVGASVFHVLDESGLLFWVEAEI